ncbi:MAG TPA: DUF3187 family protein [Chthonomonas sp.]|uniref:DUF3187 family protein n=1 Tax=Chthonomonas sp. TaxID=2282153 RepID=UPI002B4B3253|nr:DUF3187 family protein [Chthonomonas sp.]HLI48916.1 DUF3187 family protein [Chthonomonas sp.]
MRKTGFLSTGLLLLLSVLGLRGGAQTAPKNPDYGLPQGPIPLRDPRPANLLFLQFLPDNAVPLPNGAVRVGVQLDLINNLLIPSPSLGATVVEDNEYQRLMFSWHKGYLHNTELSVYVPVEWRNGGILDGIIRAYHRLFGLPANAEDDPLGRDHWPMYRSIWQIIDAQGHVLLNQGNAFGIGETTFIVKRSLLPVTSRGTLALRFGLKLPTGNTALLLGSGNVDVGLSLDARYIWGRNAIVYINIGGVRLGHPRHLPHPLGGVGQGAIAVEYRANNRDSYILQIDAAGPVMRTGNTFVDQANVTATFGYRRIMDRHTEFYASYSENGDIHNYTLPWFSNIGPDISFSFGVRWVP